MQTLRLNGILHEVRFRDDGRDSKADRDSHTTKGLRVLREFLVAAAHVARIKVRIRAHGREVQRVDAGLRQHQDADASGFSPDTIQIVPGWIVRGTRSEQGLEQVPHIVNLRRIIAIQPIFKAIRLSHIHDGLGASEKERATDVGGDVTHQLAAKARNLVVVEGREASEEHRTECKVHNELVDNASDE